jgi:serine/threonine protein phosphatase 1
MVSWIPGRPSVSDEPPRVAAGELIYAVGDVHGRRDLLLRLLDLIERDGRCRQDGRVVRLIFLGDYIDRGDDSAAVLDVLSNLAVTGIAGIEFLLGNHEAALLDFLREPERGNAWLAYGGRQTLASYGVRPPAERAEPEALVAARDELAPVLGRHLAFLEGLKFLVRSGDVVFAHAGVNPEDVTPGEDREALLWGHPACRGPEPLPGLRLVHGHFDAPEPVIHRGRICVDTGAFYSGRLTAVRLDAGEAFLTAEL